MNAHALLLVGGSAVLHATWNYFAKRASDQVAFMFLMMAASAVALVGVLAWLVANGTQFPPWYLPVAGGLCQALYSYLMGRGYECGDLSHVYPLARGLAPAIIALVAWPLLHEGLTLIGAAGIALVVLGTLTLNTTSARELFNGQSLRALCVPASRWALAAAVMIAAYHMVDKAGARASSPLAYLAVMYLWLTAFLWPLTLTARGAQQVADEWRRNWKFVLMGTVLCFAAYFMVVSAMMLSKVAYVASLRNIGILLGVVLGATALREEGVWWRLAGAGLMVAGIVAIAVGG